MKKTLKEKAKLIATIAVCFGMIAIAPIALLSQEKPRDVVERWMELCNDNDSTDSQIRECLVIRGKRSIDVEIERLQGRHQKIVDVQEGESRCVVTMQSGEGGMWGLRERKVILVKRDEGWLIDEIGRSKIIQSNDPQKIINEGLKNGYL